MAGLWWDDVESFTRDLASASDQRLREMHDWAAEREASSDRPGTGRSKKARRQYGQMRRAAAERLDERGLLWG